MTEVDLRIAGFEMPEDLDTPCVLVDVDRVDANIASMQAQLDVRGVSLRPHAKTHKSPFFARKQLEAGAVGVTVAVLQEAEVLARADIRDI